MHRMAFVFFKQKAAYEMRISDWSSDVCSSDLSASTGIASSAPVGTASVSSTVSSFSSTATLAGRIMGSAMGVSYVAGVTRRRRSEEHTSELQSLMRISYAVFCLKKKKIQTNSNAQKKATECETKKSTHTT